MQTNTCPYLSTRARIERLEAEERKASAEGRSAHAHAIEKRLTAADDQAAQAVPGSLQAAFAKAEYYLDWFDDIPPSMDRTRRIAAKAALSSALGKWQRGDMSFTPDLRAAADAFRGDPDDMLAVVPRSILAGVVASLWQYQRAGRDGN